MADPSEEVQRQVEEFEQAESSLDSGLESPPERSGIPGWVKWVIIVDVIIVAAILVFIFAG